ncbi:hypothetical protein KO525_13495 [Psychrosphaera sp. B3R10]|uniref:DUF4402 domain-containing protein n=1 Tax=Psychrosphaera algicola TaxID=3023714 RepID=A0ABT5FIX8_9GAMM|nr:MULTISPECIES: hypothetical protein [unclassified Psychrosphaera]MBU2882864.1 hypothetical protein [Psychrosphaera sp. I2R16]MBU2990397.1 hypothetical protein [Psychrosphaera sp. B3R10]MDC2891149.1 hypothetical protein [Psychrosphaera sp. G1-22]
MKKNLLNKVFLGAALVIAPLSSTAVTTSFTLAFTTVQDLQIVENNPLTFGVANVFGKAATSCTVTTAVAAASSASVGVIANSDIQDSLSSGDGGCIAITSGTANNLSGVYEITGVAGQTANVTVSSISGGTDFNFSPSGFLVQNDSTVDFSSPVAIIADNPVSITVGDNGSIVVVVGGVVNVLQDLTANTPYSGSFDITATY